MARIVLDQYRKLIDCRLVQIMDRDRDTDFLAQLVFLVLQKVDGTNLEVQFIGVPAARLYTGGDQEIHPNFTILAVFDIILSEKRDLATTREILDLQDTVRLSVLGHSRLLLLTQINATDPVAFMQLI